MRSGDAHEGAGSSNNRRTHGADGLETKVTVIAMTREVGSLGTDVAAGVAKELRLKIIHSESVATQVAERMGVEEGAVRRYADGSASALERWLFSRRKFSHYTSEEVLRLAQQGNVLIRGWGAAALLRDLPQVISVRVCAPMAFRVRTMMQKMGIDDPDTVRRDIERFDAAHVRFMRGSFNVEREELLYHLVLNTDRLPVDACVSAICELAQHPRFRDRWATRSALGDKFLEARINSALDDEISATMAPAGIRVSADKGRVTLVAASASGNLRARAEKVVASIAGVRAIDNRIVSVPSHGRRL
jgi:cytidylate kinase